jgi:pilus assembly protein Flp/PilA
MLTSLFWGKIMIKFILKRAEGFGRDSKGVTLLEYGMLAALIAAVCVGTIQLLGTDINAALQTVETAISAK